jgi:uncharacterized protein (TIGR03437 family)
MALFSASLSYSSNALVCSGSAVPLVIHSEGLAERMGDIVLSCSGGTPGAAMLGNLTIILGVNVTNKLGMNNTVDTQLTVDTGSGPSPFGGPAQLTPPNTVTFNGIGFILSASGTATLRVTNLRGDASQSVTPQQPINALVLFTSSSNVPLSNNQLTVAFAQPGLLTAASSSGVECTGSPLPSQINLASLFVKKTGFFSTRVTEGFGTSFQPKDAFSDAGTRIFVRYSGFPAAARLFVPDFVAGSSAVKPTAGGDLGLPASGGQYAPSANGSLLLIRVFGADENGGGGTLAFPVPGMGTTSFTSATEVSMTNGAGTVVYEVVDANPTFRESAQFPTFVGLTPTGGKTIIADAKVTFAPLSTINVAFTDPVPRFVDVTPQSDCSTLRDCDASYFPQLVVNTTTLNFTSPPGGGTLQQYADILNQGSGVMNWTASATYQNGSGWLTLYPTSGINNTTLDVNVDPSALTSGLYQATITVDAGPQVGSKTVLVTLTVDAGLPVPVISEVVNAATFQPGPLVAGSLGTVTGSNLAGKHVSVTFSSVPAQLLYTSRTQINLRVPVDLGFMQSAQMVVTVDGQVATTTVPLAIVSPGIFAGGILNQDDTRNSPANPAAQQSTIQILATGLASQQSGAISARIQNRVLTPDSAGPVASVPGLQQVTLRIPSDLKVTNLPLSVCAVASDPNQPVCSPAVTVAVK